MDPNNGRILTRATNGQPSSGVEQVIANMNYKSGWTFEVWADAGPSKSLKIDVSTIDPSTGLRLLVSHRFPIPLGFIVVDAERWLLDCIIAVETHEACEFFEVGGRKPFYPEHGPGSNPYRVTRST